MSFLNRKDQSGGTFTLTDHLMIGETPSGLVNSSNTVFTTANSVLGGTLDVFVNGALQQAGGGDYTFSGGNTITFNVAPPSGSIVQVQYIH